MLSKQSEHQSIEPRQSEHFISAAENVVDSILFDVSPDECAWSVKKKLENQCAW